MKYKIAYTLEGENYEVRHFRYFDALDPSTALNMFEATMEMTHEGERTKFSACYENVSETPRKYKWRRLELGDEDG